MALGTVVVFTAALLVVLIGIERPAAWMDEAATMLAVRRSWHGLGALLDGADAPMVPYYALVKVWLRFCGPLPELVAIRLLSAVAAALTAAILFVFVERRAGWRAAAVASAVLVSLPGFVRFGQEARPYALLMLTVTASWLAWGEHRWASAAGHSFARWAVVIGYPLAAAASLVTSLFAAFHWPAQLAAVVTARGRSRRQVVVVALSLCAAGLMAAMPAWQASQHGTGPQRIGSTGPLDQLAIVVLTVQAEPGQWVLAAFLTGLAVVGIVGVRRVGRASEQELVAASLWWLVVPTVLSLVIVIWRPGLLQARYFVAGLVPLSVLSAIGLVAIVRGLQSRRWLAVAAGGALGVLVVALGLPAQLSVRDSDGHDPSTPKLAAIIDAASAVHPGTPLLAAGRVSAVLMANRPDLAARNIGVRVDPDSTEVWLVPVPRKVVAVRLAGHQELIWVASAPGPVAPPPQQLPPELRGSGFRMVSYEQVATWFVVELQR